MSSNRDYYQILGVANDASFEEIRAAFRERAREYHPDRNPSPDATERMQEINEAWEVLRDEEQKASYDRARRHFAATAGRLKQARTEAIVIVGDLAFHLGWDIGAKAGNEWARASIGDENTPGALWAAALEAVLESALAGDDISRMERAAREAAWTGAHNETARQARRHALYESADSVTEAISIDMAITAVGVLASAMGKQLGEANTRIKPRSQAWKDVFEAAQAASLGGLSRYGVMLARGDRLRDSTFATIANLAAAAGRTALRTYENRIETEKRQQKDSQDEAARSRPRKRFPTKFWMFVLALGLLGGSVYLAVTPAGNDLLDRAMGTFQDWTSGGGNPAGPVDDGGSGSGGGSLPAAAAPDTPTFTPVPTRPNVQVLRDALQEARTPTRQPTATAVTGGWTFSDDDAPFRERQNALERLIDDALGVPSFDQVALEELIFDLINEYRVGEGLPALRNDPALAKIARAHSTDMATTGHYSHTNLNGQDPSGRALAAGYYCRNSQSIGIAENIIQGWLHRSYNSWGSYNWYGQEELARQHVNAWIASPGHRRNILDPRYGRTGVGVAFGKTFKGIQYAVFGTQNFC